MIGRRQAGRMRRSNRPLFLDEVQLRRKRGSQLRCGSLHRATPAEETCFSATSSAALALQTQPPPPARVSPANTALIPIAGSSTSVSKLSVCDIRRFCCLFAIGPLRNVAQYDVIESLCMVTIAPEVELRATSKRVERFGNTYSQDWSVEPKLSRLLVAHACRIIQDAY